MTPAVLALLWLLAVILLIGLFTLASIIDRLRTIERKTFDACSSLDVIADRQLDMRSDTDTTKELVTRLEARSR